jgi:hypothetical protein
MRKSDFMQKVMEEKVGKNFFDLNVEFIERHFKDLIDKMLIEEQNDKKFRT